MAVSGGGGVVDYWGVPMVAGVSMFAWEALASRDARGLG